MLCQSHCSLERCTYIFQHSFCETKMVGLIESVCKVLQIPSCSLLVHFCRTVYLRKCDSCNAMRKRFCSYINLPNRDTHRDKISKVIRWSPGRVWTVWKWYAYNDGSWLEHCCGRKKKTHTPGLSLSTPPHSPWILLEWHRDDGLQNCY